MDQETARLIAEFFYNHVQLIMGGVFILFGMLYGKLNKHNGSASTLTIVIGSLISIASLFNIFK